MFELLAKLNINFSTKDQVLELMDKCNTLLVGGKDAFNIRHLSPPQKKIYTYIYPLPSPVTRHWFHNNLSVIA